MASKTLVRSSSSSSDIYFMQRAVALARRAHPAPNPQVGAVIVKNGRVIGEGWHRKYGGPHAEIEAIKDVMQRGKGYLLAGATIYVTLEPCSHFGKTPPCTRALLATGISRVVVGCIDSNPLIAGKGIAILLSHGINVTVGVCKQACDYLYKNFFHYIAHKRPYVVLKSAMTLDERITHTKGVRTLISSTESLHMSQQLRASHDAILVGVKTVLVDNPHLGCRLPFTRQPLRIVVDSTLKIPLNSHVLRDSHVLIATTHHYDKEKFVALRARGVKFIVTKAKKEKVDLAEVLRLLPSFGVLSVLVEGGAQIATNLFEEQLVDDVRFFIAPLAFGKGVRFVSGKRKVRLKNVTHRKCGRDVLLAGKVDYWIASQR